MRKSILFIVLQLTVFLNLHIFSDDRIMSWPLSINNGYSASFQEFRGNHFHAGIDLRTFKKTGFPVYSVLEGKIFKIRCVKRGSGRGIYIRHKNGYISIYYHLQRFNRYLEKVLKRVQKIKGKYFGNYILKNPVRVNKGSIIGFSGETGSGFPHLHLEIRDQKYNALNPFKFLPFSNVDKHKPEIKEVRFRSIGATLINGINGEFIVKSNNFKESNKNKIPKVNVNGEFEIILNTYDIADTGRHVSPIAVDASLNGIKFFDIYFDKFSYSDNNQIGFVYDMFNTTYSNFYFNIFSQTGYLIDREPYHTDYIYKMLKKGSNSLIITVYDNFSNSRSVHLNIIKSKKEFDPKSDENIDSIKISEYLSQKIDLDYKLFINRDKVSILIKDPLVRKKNILLKLINPENPIVLKPLSEKRGVFFSFSPYGNLDFHTLDFSISEKGKLLSMFRKQLCLITLDKGVSKSVEFGNFTATFSKNSVYEKKVISLKKRKFFSEYPVVSDQIDIYPYTFPFMDSVYFIFKKNMYRPEQVGIFKYSFRKKIWKYVHTVYEDNNGTFKTRQLSGGVFALMRDIFPPKIWIKMTKTNSLRKIKNFFVFLTDRGKGIDDETIKIVINGEKIDSEYDPDRKWVEIKNSSHFLNKGKNTVNISVSDRGGNRMLKTVSFYLI